MPDRTKEFFVGFLPVFLFLAVIWAISRIGPTVDNKIVRMTSRYFQSVAWWISWTVCVASLILALVGVYSLPNKILAEVVLGIVPLVHLILMVKRKFQFAYWCASAEILLALFAFGSYCVGDPHEGPTINITPGAPGFWFFIFGSFGLATLAWITHRAAKDIGNGT